MADEFDNTDPFADLVPEPDAGEFEDLVPQEPPPKTKSEAVSRGLKSFTLYNARPSDVGAIALGIPDAALSMGSDIYSTIASGVGGAAGMVAGMVPGGESPMEKGARYYDRTKAFTDENYSLDPFTAGGETVKDATAGMMGMGVQGVKKIGSGYRGMAELAAGAGADRAVESMGEFMDTENATSEGVFDATQSPTLAVVAQLLPEVASMGIPAGKVRPKPKPSRYPETIDIPEGYGGIGRTEIPETGGHMRTPDPQVPAQDVYDEIGKALKSGDNKKLLDMINANPAIVRAFNELGIEFTPGMVSENQALRQIEQGVSTVPGSELGGQIERVIDNLETRSTQMIDEAGGGSRSGGTKSAVGDEIRAEYETTHRRLLDEEEVVWDSLNEQIPRGQRIDMERAANEIESLVERLGGSADDLTGVKLKKHERDIWDLTHRRDPETGLWERQRPTWEAVDRFRRDLGMGIGRQGPFNDAEIGLYRRWYEITAEQQNRFAQGNNYAANWNRMNELTQSRKALEDSMVRTLGRQQNMSPLSRIETAAKQLLDGKPEKWDELFNDLPAEARQAAAATALDNIIFTGKKGMGITESFVHNFEKLRRDPALQARIFDHLPAESRAMFMNLGEASTGFFRAMEKLRANPSGSNSTAQVVKAIEDGTLMERVLGNTRTVAEHVPIIDTLARRAPDRPASVVKQGRVQRAANLLSDPEFHQAIRLHAAGKVEEARKLLRANSNYEGWARTLTQAEKTRLDQAGLAYLFSQEEEAE